MPSWQSFGQAIAHETTGKQHTSEIVQWLYCCSTVFTCRLRGTQNTLLALVQWRQVALPWNY